MSKVETTVEVPTSDNDEEAEIGKLIEALVSTNPMPDGFGLGKVQYPPDYDKGAEARVYHAALPLVRKGTAAFPLLMKHSADDRFSFVMQSPSGAMRPHNVGDACRLIVQHQLEVYDQLGIYPRMLPSYFDEVVAGENWGNWWTTHRDKSLREIQLEACEWALSWQKDLLEFWQTEHGGEVEPSNDERFKKFDFLKNMLPEYIPDHRAELRRVVNQNEKTLTELRRRKEPIAREGPPFMKYQP